MSELFRVLVVESSPADAYLIAEALRQAGMPDGPTTFHDSRSALEYLENARQVELAMIDLNLAPFDGLQLLSRIRGNPKLADLPVIVMSGSEDQRDVKKAYQAGANCYMVKPNNLDLFLKSMRVWFEFWGSVVRLPPG